MPDLVVNVDILDDRIDVVTRGLMGLTVACARCHDHKYDPVPTADYYSLYGVFASSEEPKDAPSSLRLVDKEKPFQPVVFVRGSPGNRVNFCKSWSERIASPSNRAAVGWKWRRRLSRLTIR